MKKFLFISCCLGIMLFGLSLGRQALADPTLNKGQDCGDNNGACQDASIAPYNDPAKYTCQALGLCIGANTKCCKTAGTGDECKFPNGCIALAGCPDTKDQVISSNSTCGEGRVCCKPDCPDDKCMASCSVPLVIDSSKASCADDKVCCKTQGTGDDGGDGGTSGGKTPGASYNLADYSPVGDVDIPTLIGYIIKGALGIVGSIALLMFVYGGFLMLISQGDAAKVKKGKDALVWAAAGLVVIFGSYIFVSYILTAMTQGGSGTTGIDATRPVPCPTDRPTCSDSPTGGNGSCVSVGSNSTCTDGWCCN